YCDEPVAKRSFRAHHGHESEKEAKAKGGTATNKRSLNVDFTDVDRKPSTKRQKMAVAETQPIPHALAAPLETLAAAAVDAQMNASGAFQMPQPEGVCGPHSSIQITSGRSDTSSFSASTENRPNDGSESNYSSGDDKEVAHVVGNSQDGQRDPVAHVRLEWIALLEDRRNVATAHDMSAWLMRVFQISQRCGDVRDLNNDISDDDDVNNSGADAPQRNGKAEESQAAPSATTNSP
ncbi:MAG: hypothetical protein SGILL_002663, partial [Bacillariaceae sp.]